MVFFLFIYLAVWKSDPKPSLSKGEPGGATHRVSTPCDRLATTGVCTIQSHVWGILRHIPLQLDFTVCGRYFRFRYLKWPLIRDFALAFAWQNYGILNRVSGTAGAAGLATGFLMCWISTPGKFLSTSLSFNFTLFATFVCL